MTNKKVTAKARPASKLTAKPKPAGNPAPARATLIAPGQGNPVIKVQ